MSANLLYGFGHVNLHKPGHKPAHFPWCGPCLSHRVVRYQPHAIATMAGGVYAHGSTPSLQLDLFLRDTTAYQQALARYERLRPILQGQATLTQQSQATDISYNQLWRDLQRFQHAGLVGLLDHRTLPHTRGKSLLDLRVPLHVQHQIVRLALAHPFTARELARIVQTCYELPIDHRGIRRVLDLHQLSPAVLRLHYQTAQQATLPPFSAGQQLDLALEPTTHAQRLLQALGPDHLLLRFQTYREYPTEEQARWRIIERDSYTIFIFSAIML